MSKVRDFPAVSGSIIWARQVKYFKIIVHAWDIKTSFVFKGCLFWNGWVKVIIHAFFNFVFIHLTRHLFNKPRYSSVKI
jgi:hypothetical protein